MTPALLVAYRRRHVIAAVSTGPDFIDRNCGVRVIRRRSGARPLLWRHDPDEIARLAAAERGEEPWASTYRG